MIKTPSKFTGLKRLKQIKKDNCIAESGQEYCEYEIESLIIQKEQALAEEMAANMSRIEQAEALDLQARIERANRIMTAKQTKAEAKVDRYWDKQALEFKQARFVITSL